MTHMAVPTCTRLDYIFLFCQIISSVDLKPLVGHCTVEQSDVALVFMYLYNGLPVMSLKIGHHDTKGQRLKKQ